MIKSPKKTNPRKHWNKNPAGLGSSNQLCQQPKSGKILTWLRSWPFLWWWVYVTSWVTFPKHPCMICLPIHLPKKSTKCRLTYHTWMGWVWNHLAVGFLWKSKTHLWHNLTQIAGLMIASGKKFGPSKNPRIFGFFHLLLGVIPGSSLGKKINIGHRRRPTKKHRRRCREFCWLFV